jgi:TRAP-type mannitol/chloroaromatic compound transport system substrate-binding protein
MVARYDALNPQALRRLVAAGAQLRFWPRPVLEAAWRANEELNADLAARTPEFARIMESYNRFRTDAYQCSASPRTASTTSPSPPPRLCAEGVRPDGRAGVPASARLGGRSAYRPA